MTAPASKTDRALTILRRPFAKVESAELEARAAQGFDPELGSAAP